MPGNGQAIPREVREVIGTGDSVWILRDESAAEVGRILWDGVRPYTPPAGVVSIERAAG